MQRSLVSVFRVAWFAPVSHHCSWLSPLTGNERFILSGLNYIVPPDCWCYFTLNNMTWCSQSVQGQSLRVIDTCKAEEGAAEGRGEQSGRGKGSRRDLRVKSAASAFWGLERKALLRSYKNNCLLVCFVLFSCFQTLT